MRRSIVLAVSQFAPVVPVAQAAEAAGLHRVWTTESTGRDAILRAAAVGAATSKINIGTGITYAFTRYPVAMAGTVADTQEVCGGRFTLGMGAGTRGLRRRYQTQWDHPAPRFAEYTRVVRTLLRSTGTAGYSGDYYQVDPIEFHPPTVAAATELFGSGVNRAMLKWCAAVCDGVAIHGLGVAPGYLESVVAPAIQEGAERGGHTPKVTCWYVACVDADEMAARHTARRQLAFYLSTPSYRNVAEPGNWGDVAARIREAAAAANYADWDSVARLVPDDLVDQLAIAGTSKQVRAQLPALEDRLSAAGVDEIAFQMVGTGLSGAEATTAGTELVEAIAP